jgi:hypothetical protein
MSAVALTLGIGVALTAWIDSSAWDKRLDDGMQKAIAAPGASALITMPTTAT